MRVLAVAIVCACTQAPASGGDASPDRDARSQVDAAAATVDTEQCTHVASYGGTTANYAEHAYPGKTVADLTRLVVRARIHDGNGYTLPGYQYELGAPYINDGSAAFVCGFTNVQYIDSVDFILP